MSSHTSTPCRVQVAGGGWFDLAEATSWPGDRDFDGRNYIDINTGEQGLSQALYFSAGGRWVLGRLSNREGELPAYSFVAAEQARDWLTRNSHDQAVIEHFGAVETERGPGGRHPGPRLEVDLPAEELGCLREFAQACHSGDLAAAARDVLVIGLRIEGYAPPAPGSAGPETIL